MSRRFCEECNVLDFKQDHLVCPRCACTWYCVRFVAFCCRLFLRSRQSKQCQKANYGTHKPKCVEFFEQRTGTGEQQKTPEQQKAWVLSREWCHRNRDILGFTLYNAIKLPQTLHTFIANPLVFFFKCDFTKQSLYDRLILQWVRIADNARGETDIIPFPLPDYHRTEFPASWAGHDAFFKATHSPIMYWGLGGYIIAIEVAEDDIEFFVFSFPVLAPLFFNVERTARWERRLLRHIKFIRHHKGE